MYHFYGILQNILQYQLTDPSIPWAAIFHTMEDLKGISLPSKFQVIQDSSDIRVAPDVSKIASRPSNSKESSENGQATYKDIIEDYTVSLTSLEEVFLSFARKQYSGRDNFSRLRQLLQCKSI
jgi:hypothetical protein